MRFSKDALRKIFEESFDDEVDNIHNGGHTVSFYGEEYSMEYNFLRGDITFSGIDESRIGTIFIVESNISSYEVDPSSPFGYYVGLFEVNLRRHIELSQKKTRRRFIAK